MQDFANNTHKNLVNTLYLHAKNKGEVQELNNDMQNLASLHQEMLKMQIDSKLSPKNKLSFLIETFKDLNLSSTTLAFIDTMIANQNINLVFQIATHYKTLSADLNNIKFVEVISTIPLNNNQIDKIKTAVSKETNGIVEIKNIVNPNIIGGLKIKINNYIIDDSVENYINQLSNTMKGLSINENS